jgi:hypothetical protein
LKEEKGKPQGRNGKVTAYQKKEEDAYFAQSAHGSARGTFITPESVSITDRTHVISYSDSGINNAPLCLKWIACCFSTGLSDAGV